MELSILTFVFFNVWKAHKKFNEKKTESIDFFTTLKSTCHEILPILLAKWNVTVAWILTFLSVYSGIQIFGFVKSMFKRPISIENDKLFLRYGIMNETTIQLSNIDSIEISSKDLELNKETRKLSFLRELESHNVVIRLKEENTLVGLYGIKRKYKNLALHVDKKNEFKNHINNALKQWL